MVVTPHHLWPSKFEGTIVPETFVEITMGVTDTYATNNAEVSTFNENSVLSNTINLVGANERVERPYYVTLEENRWVLDGTRNVRADYLTTDPGFVGDSPESSNNNWLVTFELPQPTTTVVPGIDILWDSEFGEKPPKFDVLLRNTVSGKRYVLHVENDAVSGTYHPDASSTETMSLDLVCDTPGSTKIIGDFSDYNTVVISISGWDTPNHRPRMDRFVFGYTWVFDKTDILNYTHEQTGDLLGAELPKNSISFSLDNTDDKWNPNNPEGFGKYVTDRQMITVRYGLDVNSNGRPVWIPAGVFYLSDWNAPSNGLEAMFTARDPFEFMMSVPYSGVGTGATAWEVVQSALSLCEFPNKLKVRLVDGWDTEVAVGNLGKPVNGVYDCSVAEMLQMCACIMHCVMWFDRDGTLQMVSKPWNYSTNQVFDIPLDLAYSYPEVSLSKPIKYVSIRCTNTAGEVDAKLLTEQCEYGETQSFELLMVNEGVVNNIFADFIKPVVKYREQVSGEYRSDPRLDVFDLVNVETKYGDMLMVLTGIKYTYTGSFHGEYLARKVSITEEALLEGDVTEVEI
jgi:hypothetical protein